MATQEKLLKSLEGLQQLINTKGDNVSSRKKEKVQHCHFITEAITNSAIKIAPNFNQLLSFTFETLLELCNDSEADIRTIADESLNKIIRILSVDNIGKIQLELHKEIKKNGAARSLKAALWRFGNLAHMIRAHKGKPYVVNLVPCIVKVTEREEEFLHDALTEAFLKILKVLGCFTTDSDVKTLMKAFLKNIGHSSRSIRRNSAQCLLTLCLNSRKPYYFLVYTLNQILDLLLPLDNECDNSLILGVLGWIKVILPNLTKKEEYQEMMNSFGAKKDLQEINVSLDRQIQIYELCLHYLSFSDHNVVNMALETLNVLLQYCQPELKEVLLSTKGITQSKIKDVDPDINKGSPYELSIASSRSSEEKLLDSLSDPLTSDIEKWIDQSTLSIINVNYASQLKNVPNEKNTFDVVDTGDLDCVNISKSNSDLDEFTKTEGSFENVNPSEEVGSQYSYLAEDTVSIITLTDVTQDIDIGTFKDSNVPLIYCSRLISKYFLLTGQPKGLIPDRNVRVSVKNLALTCLGSILQLYPDILLLNLDVNYTKVSSDSKQFISDILLFENDPDPQLAGITRIVVASFLKSVLKQSLGRYDEWLRSKNGDNDVFKIENLVQLLIRGLEHDSSICVRQSLSSLSYCMKELLYSDSCRCVLPILKVLPSLAKDPYWLVKIKLVEIVTDFEYITIEYVTGNHEFQNKILHNVLFELLKDDDQRVRNATSNAIVKIIPLLYFQQQTPNQNVIINKAIEYKNKYLRHTNNLNDGVNIFKNSFLSTAPFPFNVLTDCEIEGVEFGLSRIILKLYEALLTSTSKHLIYGCIETLCLLSQKYPCTVYKTSWNCFKNFNFQQEKTIFQRSNSIIGSISSICESNVSGARDLLNISISLFTHITVYDLGFHSNLLRFTGNLFAGKCLEDLQLLSDSNLENNRPLWDMFNDKILQELSEAFLTHVVKLLNVFMHVIEETTPQIIIPKPVLPNLPPASSLSPLKRRKSDLDKKLLASVKTEKDEKTEKKPENVKNTSMGYFANSPHYMKIYDILRMAYLNYKITLDSSASENLLNFLKTTLLSLCQILEVATITETGRIADDILRYLRATFYLDQASTVCCVHQLLKSLFGTNLTSGLDCVQFENKNEQKLYNESGFYYNLFQQPYSDLSNYIYSLNHTDKVECDSDSTVMGYLHRKEVKKPTPKGSDKILANYIRIFEPMVIKSLKQYTISSDVNLQCNVLQLLSQLVQLRVNYCLLDSEQIFIGFVLKQFEFIEEAQIPQPEKLIPKIFKFLVHLSYSKHHSKSIINVPKIIHLCDGLMASGQNPITYCIPALEPIVEDIFLVRNRSNTVDFKELETTREVLLSMLLRLIEYKEVIVLLTLILNESKYCENNEKWHRWSKQVFDVFLTLLKHNKLRLDDGKMIEAVMKLLVVMNPGVFKNVNEILVCLFQKPPLKGDSINRYLGKVIIIFLMLTQVKEEVLLNKINESSKDFVPSSIFENIEVTPDPLNVINHINYFEGMQPEVIFVKLIFKVFEVTPLGCLEQSDDFLVEQMFYFMVIIFYLISGGYSKITNTVTTLLNSQTTQLKIPIEVINKNFIKIGILHPALLYQWCYILTVLNYHNDNFWNSLVNKDFNCKNTSLHLQIVQLGVSLAYCEYLTENVHSLEQLKKFLYQNINLIIDLCDELPVNEFITTLNRESNTSRLILKAVEDNLKRNYPPSYLIKILRCLENSNTNQTGYLILLLTKKFLNCRQLALQRSVSTLTSRKVEYLLTLTQKEVHAQLTKENLTIIMNIFKDNKFAKRNEGLLSLLNKLSVQFYDLTPLELNQRRCVNPESIKRLQVDKMWYLKEIKKKCQGVTEATENAELLHILEYKDMIDVMSEKTFSKMILKDVIVIGSKLIENKKGDERFNLFNAAVEVLFKDLDNLIQLIPEKDEIYLQTDGFLSSTQNKYSIQLTQLFSNNDFLNTLNDLIPGIIAYIDIVDTKISDSNANNICKFFVTALESITFLITTEKSEVNVHFINRSLQCACTVLKNNQLVNILSLNENFLWLCSSTNVIYNLVSFLLLDFEPLPQFSRTNLKQALQDGKSSLVAIASYQLFVLIAWIESLQVKERKIPSSLYKPIKKIIICLSRLPQVNSYVLTPPSVWKSGWNVELIGPFKTQVPPLPVDYVQQIEVLEEFIYRINLLGWRNRQQFEETWMCLLSVLSSNPEEDCLEEVNRLSHATGLAVSAITAILVMTLYYPNPGNRNNSKILHVSRDSVIGDHSASIKKLQVVQRNLIQKFNACSNNHQQEETSIINVFDKPNLEKHHSVYSIGQISIEYLLISSKIAETPDEQSPIFQLYRKKHSNLSECGVDLNSCIQFLLDLYSQWLPNNQTHPNEQNTPLRVINEVIKSVLIISDLFLEKSQFQWMLDSMLALSKTHASEDEILHQYLIINISKAVAVLSPDMEIYDFIKRTISQGLKSSFLAMRIASLQGLLYILQGCVLSNTVIGGITEELQLFLPVITEYIQCNINTTNNVLMRSQDHCLLLWAITFYLIEHIQEIHLPVDIIANSVQTAINVLTGQKCTKVLYTAVIKGLERLIIIKCLPERLHEQITKLAIDKMKDNNPIYAIPAVQLLISCMYIECEDQLEDTEKSNGIVQTTPDNLVKTIEKISAIFDKIKKGNPFEVEILCGIIPNILNDFFVPSDILTKVVGEFLSPQQNHPKLLSRVVFQVFESGIEQKQLPLLQDWVLFSLSNFAQSFSVGMATWCLTCFFISASTNPWLRSFFPYVQSRIGRYEHEDKKLLCITGSDFYKNLTTDKQRETFVDTFRKIKNQVDMPFNNLLASL